MWIPVMQKDVGEAVPPRGSLVQSTCSVITQQESVYIFLCLFVFFFLNNERILMPHIDYTLYVQTKGELEKVR